MQIRATVNEQERDNVQPGLAVKVDANVAPGPALDAKVEEVLKQVDRCAPLANALTKEVNIKQVQDRGPILGLITPDTWPVTEFQIPEGGLMLLYTDGLPEARQGDVLFGWEGVVASRYSSRCSRFSKRIQPSSVSASTVTHTPMRMS